MKYSLATDRQMDGQRRPGVLVKESRFTVWVRNSKNKVITYSTQL